MPPSSTAPSTTAHQAPPATSKPAPPVQPPHDTSMDEDLDETHEPQYFGPRGPTAAESEAMVYDGAHAGLNEDETFNIGGGDGAAFEHQPYVPLHDNLKEIPTPEIPKTDASRTSGAEQSKEQPPKQQKK